MESNDADWSTMDAMSRKGNVEVDVLIVGARVAGASLAALLAQHGHRVLMVDRDRFPSDCLSTHFMVPEHVGLLAELGVLADVEAAGFRHITRSRTWVDDCLLEGPLAPGGAYGLAPRRDILDALIIEHAVLHGAELWARTRADALIQADGCVIGATVTPHGGEARQIRARVVVGADGRHSKVAERVAAPRYSETPGLRPFYYGYFHGLEPLEEAALEMLFVDGRIGFVFPMQPGIDCLGLVLQPEDFHEFRSSPRERFLERFGQLPTMARRLSRAELEGKMQGVRSVANFFRKPYGPGWALTGDAAYLKDPIGASGMGDALVQSFLLAAALHAVLNGAAEWETTMAAYQQQRDAELEWGLHFAVSTAREPDPSQAQLAWLRAALAVPHTTRTMTQLLPAVLQDAIPPEQQPLLGMYAQAFGAASNQAVEVVAD